MRKSYDIHFDDIKVNSIDNLSGIFIGQSNTQCNWSSHQKSNSGFGSSSGEGNMFTNNVNIVIDPDEIDNPNF
jgi:hypothetical protein